VKRLRTLLQSFDIREERTRVATVLAVVAALNLIFYLTLNLPRMHRRGVAERGLEQITRNLGELSRRVALVKDLDERYTRQQRKLDSFYHEVLGSKEGRMIRIQREVRALAASFGMDPEMVNYSPEFLTDVGLVRFQINVPLVGDYRNLRQFISKIEQSENFLMIEGVALGGAKDGGALLDLNIQLSTYFEAPEMMRPEPEQKAPPGAERT
jgi:Tfp pilus assembly protein PilO